MNKWLLIAAKTGESLDGSCRGLLPVVKIIRKGVWPIVQIGIPIMLLVMGTVDLGKAVIASDEKEIKAAQGRLIKRVIYAVVVFLMTTIVSLVMNLVATSDQISDEDAGSWAKCWDAAK